MTFYNFTFRLLNPLNQTLITDKYKTYNVIIAKNTNKILLITENQNDINNFNLEKVKMVKADLLTIMINDILYHYDNISKIEAVIFAYGYFERISLKKVLDYFGSSDITSLRTLYYKDPALFKYRMASLLNFELKDFEKEYKLGDDIESKK